MKPISAFFLLLVSALLLVSCSKTESPKLEVFSAEAFGFSMGDGGGWDVTATARVKGFAQEENAGDFKMNVSFSVELINKDGKKTEMYKGEQKQSAREKLTDQPLEAQFGLDSTYAAGKYKIIFNVTDNISSRKTVVEKELELGFD